jgi:hypothetical protein
VEYDFPPHVKVSRECRDLLSCILVADPAKRYTIEDIQKHPWYLRDLPPGVKEMNNNLPAPAPGLQSTEEIKAIVQEAQRPPKGPPGWEDDGYIDDAVRCLSVIIVGDWMVCLLGLVCLAFCHLLSPVQCSLASFISWGAGGDRGGAVLSGGSVGPSCSGNVLAPVPTLRCMVCGGRWMRKKTTSRPLKNGEWVARLRKGRAGAWI